MKINFDRLHKLLLCFKISRLENNAGARARVFYMASISRRRGEEEDGGEKKGGTKIGTFQRLAGTRLFCDIVYGVFASSRSSFRSLYKLCNLYSAAPRIPRASSTIPSENFFHYTPYVSAEKEKNHSKKKKKK